MTRKFSIYESPFKTLFISGGNQRDLARAKNAKKQEQMKKAQGANQKDSNKVIHYLR